MYSKLVATSLLLIWPATAHAATARFSVRANGAAWTCTDASTPDVAAGLTVQVLINGAPDQAQVALKVTYQKTSGAAATEAALPHAKAQTWQFVDAGAKPPVGSAVTISGTIAGAPLSCAGKILAPPAEPSGDLKKEDPAPTKARYAELDPKASDWLHSTTGQLALRELERRLVNEFPSLSGDRVAFLKHLPSGAPAFPFPTSVSERQAVQIVSVLNRRNFTSVELTLTNCARAQRERIKGDFGVLAANPQAADTDPDFGLLPIGTLIQCGPESLAYTITSGPAADEKGEARSHTARLDVRPVYHLAATAFLGFDRTQRSTFPVQNGTVGEVTDRIGTDFLIGATWYPFGTDYGDMRWRNRLINPFVAVKPGSPKDDFVVGNAFTVTGGVSLAIGAAFHRLERPDGIDVGAPFTGDGEVKTIKHWSDAGLYVGIAIDTNVLTALKKTQGDAAKAKTGGN